MPIETAIIARFVILCGLRHQWRRIFDKKDNFMLPNPIKFFSCSHAPALSNKIMHPAVLLVRHSNLKGPLRAFFAFREHPHIWVLDCFFHYRSCYEQYRNYTFSLRKGKKTKRFSLCAAIAAAVVVPMIHLSGAIPVYRGSKSIQNTFQQSIALLKQKKRLIIAVDKNYKDEYSKVDAIYSGFFHLETLYFEETGEHLPFIVLHFDKSGNMICSPPLYFNKKSSFRQQRKELTSTIIHYLNGKFH